MSLVTSQLQCGNMTLRALLNYPSISAPIRILGALYQNMFKESRTTVEACPDMSI